MLHEKTFQCPVLHDIHRIFTGLLNYVLTIFGFPQFIIDAPTRSVKNVWFNVKMKEEVRPTEDSTIRALLAKMIETLLVP